MRGVGFGRRMAVGIGIVGSVGGLGEVVVVTFAAVTLTDRVRES
jgi:hypothetical protein